MDNEDELKNVTEVMKDSTLSNPDLTFCEKTTYFDFLLSSAKDEDEKEEIKKTIDNYLEIANDEKEDD